jgi:hypothetical protein
MANTSDVKRDVLHLRVGCVTAMAHNAPYLVDLNEAKILSDTIGASRSCMADFSSQLLAP